MIARKTLLMIISKVISAILSMVCFVFILRFMGFAPTESLRVYGSIITAMSFVATFTFVADLGFGMAHMKRVSEGKDLAKCIGTYASIRLSLTALMVGIVLSSIAVWKYVLHGSFSYAINETLVYLFLLYYVVFNISSIATGTFDAKTETAKSQFSALAEPVIRTPLIIIIGVSGFVPNNLKIYYIAFAYLAGVATLLFVSLLFFRNYPVKRPDRETFKYYTAFAVPFMVISIVGIVVTYIDKLIIGYFWSPIEVGQYAGVQGITLNLYFISFAVGSILFPMMSTHFSKKEVTKIRELTYDAERYISMLITPIVFLILVFAEEILQLINAGLIPAANVFRLLALAILFSSTCNPHTSQIIALNRTVTAVKVNLVQAMILVSGYFLLVPKSLFGVKLLGMGINGAAIAYLFAVCIGLVVSRYFAWRLTETKFKPCIVLHLVAGCIMSAVLYLITVHVFHFVRWYELLAALLIGAGIYTGLLALFKEFDKKDVSFIFDTINPGKMKHYVTTEIKKKHK